MGLFKRDQDPGREAADAAAQAEVTRLATLPPNAIAAELLPAFGPQGAKSKGRIGTAPMQLIEWLMTDFGRGADTKPLVSAVLVGMSALERGGLVAETTSGTGSGGRLYSVTPLGEKALSDGTAGSYLT
jgi:hypothetical protein